MKWALVIVAVLAGTALLLVAVGVALPRGHTEARRARLAAPPERVWVAVTTPAAFPSWRSDLTAVEMLDPATGDPANVGRARWREVSRHGRITYEVVAASPPAGAAAGTLRTRIADPDLPFGGEWDVTVAAATGGGTDVFITERGEVYNPVFRVLSRIVFGHAATMERYLRDLGGKFAETVEPVPAAPGEEVGVRAPGPAASLPGPAGSPAPATEAPGGF